MPASLYVQGATKKLSTEDFLAFSEQWLSISLRIFTDLFSHDSLIDARASKLLRPSEIYEHCGVATSRLFAFKKCTGKRTQRKISL